MARLPSRTRLIQAVALILCLVFILRRPEIANKAPTDWHVSSWIPRNPTNRFRIPPECDPYTELGHLFTSDELHESRYIIYNDRAIAHSDAPAEDWVVPSLTAALLGHKFEELSWMRNQTVLMIGDSIDRNLVTHFGRRALAGTKGGHEIFFPPEDAKVAVSKQVSHQIGRAYSPELNFTLYNWFLMGLGVQNEVPFFHPREDLPQRFEARFETFFLPLLRKRLLPRPDMVVFNTGFWDLEYLARTRLARYKLPDVKQRAVDGPTSLTLLNRGDGNPLSLTELAYHRVRMRAFINHLRTTLAQIDSEIGPRKRPLEIMYRSMQLGNASNTNAFAAERIRQIEESNRIVLTEFNIPIIEWGKLTIGLDHQLDDPPIHYGIGSAQYIFGDMLLYYLKRLVDGTKNEWIGCDWIRHRQLMEVTRA